MTLKKIGAISLVAGTCIGSGMIALPMVLAAVGIIPGVIAMLVIWAVVYYSALINLELNLQAGEGLTLGALAKLFSGWKAALVGNCCMKVLSYALLSVYLYGGASIMQNLLDDMGHHHQLSTIASAAALVTLVLLTLPFKHIEAFNRIIFIILLIIILVLVVGLASIIDWGHLPLWPVHYGDWLAWRTLLPVLFTSFGFQVIFHTLTNYCNCDKTLLKSVFGWGSLIPALVYIVWSVSVLSIIYSENPDFYLQMAAGQSDVGDLVRKLSVIAQWPTVQILVWCLSLLAIGTSLIGVAVGLCQSWEGLIAGANQHQLRIPTQRGLLAPMCEHLLAPILVIVPPWIAAIVIPKAFIAALGFAGMILAVMAIILPVYLFYCLQSRNLYYAELKANWLIWLMATVGIALILCELGNMHLV